MVDANIFLSVNWKKMLTLLDKYFKTVFGWQSLSTKLSSVYISRLRDKKCFMKFMTLVAQNKHSTAEY